MEENVKTKNNKGVIIFLVLIIVALVGYIVADKFIINDNKAKTEEKENKKKETKKEEFKYPEKLSDHTFIKMDDQTIKMNGEDHKLITYYYYDTETDPTVGGERYAIKKEIYFDNTKVYDLHTFNFLAKDETTYTYVAIVDEDIKLTKNIITDSSNNNEYLLVNEYTNETLDGYALLLDKDGNVLEKIQTKMSNTGIRIEDKDINKNTTGYMEHSFNKDILYIGKNYLYQLDVQNCYYTSSPEGPFYADEYLIKVENGKLNKVKTITYSKELQVAGGIPNCKKH